jgi:hypothetical protein
VPSSSGSSRSRLLELHGAKDEGTNMGIYAPSDTVSHPRRLESLIGLIVTPCQYVHIHYFEKDAEEDTYLRVLLSDKFRCA